LLEKRIIEKLVCSFLDIIVMTVLHDTPTYGYEIIATIHKEFGVLLSPGTLYPLLHSLEERELIEPSHSGGRIVYRTTQKGKQKFRDTLSTFSLTVEKISDFIKERNGETILAV
jgi:PadR family transcriptional regulator PadR